MLWAMPSTAPGAAPHSAAWRGALAAKQNLASAADPTVFPRSCCPHPLLNFVWQGPSWSGMNYNGSWKLLHHAARSFFAPLGLSGVVANRSGGDAQVPRGTRCTTMFSLPLSFSPSGALLSAALLAWSLPRAPGDTRPITSGVGGLPLFSIARCKHSHASSTF